MLGVIRHPLVFATLSLFVGISLMVVTGVIQAVDDTILDWIGGWRPGPIIHVMLVLSVLGDGGVAVPVALVLCVLIRRRLGKRHAHAAILAGVSAEVLNVALKALIQRPRPAIIDRLAESGWYAYPSGHAMLAPVLWGLPLLFLAQAQPPGKRAPLVVAAVLIPLLIAASRVILGVHYPSDVLGALALGTAVALGWLGWANAASTSRSASTR
jgi:undecaprenyl-diphosphatase